VDERVEYLGSPPDEESEAHILSHPTRST